MVKEQYFAHEVAAIAWDYTNFATAIQGLSFKGEGGSMRIRDICDNYVSAIRARDSLMARGVTDGPFEGIFTKLEEDLREAERKVVKLEDRTTEKR